MTEQEIGLRDYLNVRFNALENKIDCNKEDTDKRIAENKTEAVAALTEHKTNHWKFFGGTVSVSGVVMGAIAYLRGK